MTIKNVHTLLLLGADFILFLSYLFYAILTQSFISINPLCFPNFLTAAFANFYGKLTPTASAAFIRYSNDNFPYGFDIF